MRPIRSEAWDAPNPEQQADDHSCLKKHADGPCKISKLGMRPNPFVHIFTGTNKKLDHTDSIS